MAFRSDTIIISDLLKPWFDEINEATIEKYEELWIDFKKYLEEERS